MAERSMMFRLLYMTTELRRLSTARSCASKMAARFGAKSPGESSRTSVSCGAGAEDASAPVVSGSSSN